MIIVSEGTDKAPFRMGMDIHPGPPPYLKELTEEEEREATINLFGGLVG